MKILTLITQKVRGPNTNSIDGLYIQLEFFSAELKKAAFTENPAYRLLITVCTTTVLDKI